MVQTEAAQSHDVAFGRRGARPNLMLAGYGLGVMALIEFTSDRARQEERMTIEFALQAERERNPD